MKRTVFAVAAVLFAVSWTAAAQKPKPESTAAATRQAQGAGAKGEAAAPKKLVSDAALTGLAFRNIGPAIMSGRISDIAIHPKKRARLVRGGRARAACGRPRTPARPGRRSSTAQASYSIGCITLDPSNPETVWVGTGENVSGRHVGYRRRRLQEPERRQDLDEHGPHDSRSTSPGSSSTRATPNVVYVAAEGPLWSSGGERGLYKSADGGKTWTISLEISKDTGVDLAPSSTRRTPTSSTPRPTSAGARWPRSWAAAPSPASTRATTPARPGASSPSACPRATWARSAWPSRPSTRASSTRRSRPSPDERGFYRSTDRGESWEKRNSLHQRRHRARTTTRRSSPTRTRFDRVYQMDPGLRVTDDGGKTWRRGRREEQARRQPRDGLRQGRPRLHPERQRRRRLRDPRPRRRPGASSRTCR